MDLVRKNKPHLLNKPPQDGDVVVVDMHNFNQYIFRMTDGIYYSCTGMRIPQTQLPKLVTRFQSVDCEYDWETMNKYGKVRIFSINPKFVFNIGITVNASDKDRKKHFGNVANQDNIWNTLAATANHGLVEEMIETFNQTTETNDEIF